MKEINHLDFTDPYEEEFSEEYRYPHCDASILHSPGSCQYCDNYPNRQQDRIESNTNFSNENDPDKLPCPSTYLRTAEVRDRWPGNRAYPEGMPPPMY